MSDTRAWGDCPKCRGLGVWWPEGDAHTHQPTPCPTCAAHFKAVDEAVGEVGREYERVLALIDNMGCATGEDWEGYAADYQTTLLRVRSLLPATHPQGQPPPKEGGKE